MSALLAAFISAILSLSALATTTDAARKEMTRVTDLDPRTLALALRKANTAAIRTTLAYRIRRGTDALLDDLHKTSARLQKRCMASLGANPEICANQLKVIAEEERQIRQIASQPITARNVDSQLRLATAVYTHQILADLLVPRGREMNRSCRLGNQITFTTDCAAEHDRAQEIRNVLSEFKELLR